MAIGYQRAGKIDLALPWAEKAAKKIDRPGVHLAYGGILLAQAEAEGRPRRPTREASSRRRSSSTTPS